MSAPILAGAGPRDAVAMSAASTKRVGRRLSANIKETMAVTLFFVGVAVLSGLFGALLIGLLALLAT